MNHVRLEYIMLKKLLIKLFNLLYNNIIMLTLHLIRHAESCANYAEGYYDKGDEKRNIGYNSIPKIISDRPPTENIKNKDHDFTKEPNLTYIGMQQAILLGTNFLKKQNYDIIICSPMIITCMTSLFG